MNKTLIATAVGMAVFSGTALADSWTLVQDVTINTATTITQNGSTRALQAVNAINDVGAGAVLTGDSSQDVTYGGTAGMAIQQGVTTANNNSVQALNYANAELIDNKGSTPFGQTVSATGAATGMTMTQGASGMGVAADNSQAMNYAKGGSATATAGGIAGISQGVTTNSITMNQIHEGTSSSDNTQAVNAVITVNNGTVSNATQTISSDMAMTQTVQDENTQAGNYINSAKALSSSRQTMTVNGSAPGTMEQNDNGQAYQFGNAAISGATVEDLSQEVTGSLNVTQGTSTTGVGNGSIQAVNSIESTDQTAGYIKRADQDLGAASLADTYNFVQTNAGNGTIQAGNLIAAMELGTATDKVTQDIAANQLSLEQTSSNTSLQAGNAVLTDYGTSQVGGDADQTIVVNTLSLVQTNVTGAIQAGNYGGTMPPAIP